MADCFIPGLLQSSDCKVIRRRELPIRGQILAQKEDVVSPDTIVAKAELPGDVQILRIAESMGIDAADASAGIRVRAGESVSAGQVLCEHRGLFGLFRSQYKAPADGTVDFVSEALGHIGLRMPSQILSLNAYCGGTVREVQDGYSLEIETNATVIQGIFGVGGERLGTIRVLDVDPQQALRREHLPSDISGSILVGGTLPDIAVLELLSAKGAAGLVVGGIDDSALKQFLGYDIGLAVTGNEEISFSLMVSEGFGNLALSERVISLFARHRGSFACMNGTTQIRAGAIRPEVIIPSAPAKAEICQQSAGGLSLGARVRLIRVPYFGMTGEVVELPHKPEKLEAGSFARVLRVRLADGQIVTVPRANAEIA